MGVVGPWRYLSETCAGGSAVRGCRWEDEAAYLRSRTARVMTRLMRNGRDRRSENPLLGQAMIERVVLVGTDQRITSGPAATAAASHRGKPPSENRPDTWLHPNASQKVRSFPLHRGRRPYMAPNLAWGVATLAAPEISNWESLGPGVTCPQLSPRRGSFLTASLAASYDRVLTTRARTACRPRVRPRWDQGRSPGFRSG
jgi:hypothetical protein